jgi:uridine kinase
MRAYQFITEAQDSDAVNELDLFIMNDEDLYRRRFMPIITNIKRKIKRGVYDHEKVIKLWMYLIDDAARKYVQEFGTPEQDVKDMFPKETRLQVAQVIADREKENIEKGEYDVVKGIVSPRG